jgi:hypothetical protein
MPRHVFTQEERRRGAANQPHDARVQAAKKGFEVTCERHPYFARHWLKYCAGMRRANGTKPEKQEEEA